VSEAISNALGRAQTLSFTVFSAALVVTVVVLASLDEKTSSLARLNTEFNDVQLVATHSDNVIREIRRYMLAKRPPSISEQQALQDIRHAFFHAHEQAELASTRLFSAAHPGVSLRLVRQINRELAPMRDLFGAIVSVNVDVTPQSVVLLDSLEKLSFRDLSVMAHIASVDPIGVNEAVSAFNRTWDPAAPADAAQQLAGKLKTLGAERSASFEQIGTYGKDLRVACEQFGKTHGNLAVGGLRSSNTRALATLISLQDDRAALRDQLSGSFQISVPVVDQTLPVPVVTLLLPLALVAGYGLIGTALLFARRQLKAITDNAGRRTAADNGFVFDQLYSGGLPARVLNWLLLGAITIVPLAAAALLAYQFSSALSGTSDLFMAVFLLTALGVILLIFGTAHEISRMASGRV